MPPTEHQGTGGKEIIPQAQHPPRRQQGDNRKQREK